MNYFRVNGLALLGQQGIPVEVECVQSRRLPYLQVIGASSGSAAELRERVMAAIESSGERLPARRTTVRFKPGVARVPLESLDLAVALAILAAGGKVPAARLQGMVVYGSLGLDGSIYGTGGSQACRRWAEEIRARGALVPFPESGWLPEAFLANGGGFSNLAEVVQLLRGGVQGRKMRAESSSSPPAGIWSGNAEGLRLLEIAAAGEHHLLLLAPGAGAVGGYAEALAQLRPSPARAHWYGGPPAGPLDQWHPADELIAAAGGVLAVEDLRKCDAKSLPLLLAWMESGRLDWKRAGFAFRETLTASVVAGIAACECGGAPRDRCMCRPLGLQAYRRRLDSLSGAGFDLRYFPGQVEGGALSLQASREKISRARETLRQRRLADDKPDRIWPEKSRRMAARLAREYSLGPKRAGALERVASTICDLREGKFVAEDDLLEARHYSAAD